MAISFAGLTFDRPRVMGVVNVTPDSFSDGGEIPDSESAIARGIAMAEQGADILDIGGESTRPGAVSVPPDTQIARVVPVISDLAKRGYLVSVDTRSARVMEAAIEAGAAIINDVSALTEDEHSLDVLSGSNASVVLMHMRGDPQTMQDGPKYDNVTQEIFEYLSRRIEAVVSRGVGRERIAIDPGIGFGKTQDHNLTILNQIDLFGDLSCAILVGVSRKSFIGHLSHDAAPKERLPGSLAAGLAAIAKGAHILRVHDVGATVQALTIWQAIRNA